MNASRDPVERLELEIQAKINAMIPSSKQDLRTTRRSVTFADNAVSVVEGKAPSRCAGVVGELQDEILQRRTQILEYREDLKVSSPNSPAAIERERAEIERKRLELAKRKADRALRASQGRATSVVS